MKLLFNSVDVDICKTYALSMQEYAVICIYMVLYATICPRNEEICTMYANTCKQMHYVSSNMHKYANDKCLYEFVHICADSWKIVCKIYAICLYEFVHIYADSWKIVCKIYAIRVICCKIYAIRVIGILYAIHWHPLPAHINDNVNVMHVSAYICAAHFADQFEQHAQA